MSFGEYLDYWLANNVKARVKPRTYENYEYVIRMHLRPALGGVKPDKLRASHLQNLYADKLALGSHPGLSSSCTRLPRRPSSGP